MNKPTSRRWLPWLFATTVFTSAFLLFQVQPLISKFILPWFGGTPAVWTTCMLFFQVTLFLGYLYAHGTSRYLSPRGQAILHIALLGIAACLLPITPDASWKPDPNTVPAPRIVMLLTFCVGLPYFILSSTGPLLQRWFSLRVPGPSPYRLYALSNVGSLLALVTYPFVVEPTMGSPLQAVFWSGAFAVFALLCTTCAGGLLRKQTEPDSREREADPVQSAVRPSRPDAFRWFGLAMVASVMLLATTNQVCLDVATIPFLWIVPLTLYLLSFILCFDAPRWYSPKGYSVALVLLSMFVIRVMINGAGVPILVQIPIYFSALFACCMVCHGELARRKPEPQYLTRFYLWMSAGGAAGGVFVGLIAPYTFTAYWEMHIAVIAGLAIGICVYFKQTSGSGGKSPAATQRRFRPGQLVWPAMFLWAGGSLAMHARTSRVGVRDVSRNFYGVLKVQDLVPEGSDVARRELFHGRIRHGSQLLDSEQRSTPTTYYGRTSGSGLAMRFHKPNQPRRVGVVGMGVGTLAAYGKSGDVLRFYEINPEVIRLAKQYFTFLSDTPARCDLVLGDARLSLERERQQAFDILVLDAFSGDAIPTHLLTREAFALYDHHVVGDGLLCVHISNLHFDLRPVVHGLAQEFGWHTLGVQSQEDESQGTCLSQWVVMSRKPIDRGIRVAAEEVFPVDTRRLLWTDEWSNLSAILQPSW